jgi:hypothetical protein
MQTDPNGLSYRLLFRGKEGGQSGMTYAPTMRQIWDTYERMCVVKGLWVIQSSPKLSSQTSWTTLYDGGYFNGFPRDEDPRRVAELSEPM